MAAENDYRGENSVFTGTFWDNSYWYPLTVSWEQVEIARQEGTQLARPSDLLWVLPMTIAVLVFRYFYEKCVCAPLASYVFRGKDRRAPEPCSELDQIYKKTNKFDEKKHDTPDGWTIRRAQRWFRRRRNQDRPDLKKKFRETFYRFSVYVFLWGWAVFALYDKEWLWDSAYCFVDFPYQHMDGKVLFLYLIELAFYFSLVVTLFNDVKRKDFPEQIIHHFATITLVSFSYMANFIRIGTLVLILHDISDIFLEGAKLFVYQKKTMIADILFGCFAVIFLITRDVMFPWMVLHTALVKSMWLFEPYFAYYWFNAFLMVIQILNWFWSFTILRMAYRLLTTSDLGDDARSDAEEESSDGEEE